MDGKLLAFFGIAIVLIITPGPDMALVTKNALSHGRRGALLSTLGIGTALLVHATVAALGLSALLRTASTLFAVVKLCGAAYLAFLGVRTLWMARGARSGGHVDASATSAATPDRRRSSPYAQGVLSALLNPKLVVFFATFLPQFVDPHQPVLPQMLLLGALFDVMGLVWLTGFGLFVTRMQAFFGAAQVRRRMERLTGLVLVALGARLAIEKS
jgi:threonine/homoserine/homoserine lactone efflux protein